MNIIDLHCDTIIQFYEGRHLADMEEAHISLKKLRKGGSLAQCFAIFVPTGGAAEYHGITDTPQEYFDKAYARFEEELRLNSSDLAPARSMKEILENEAAGRMSAILTVEDGITLDGKLENVKDYYDKGVRMVALTWNFENSLGFPNSADPKKHALGLKPFGIEAVRYMNELGIAVDVSHLSEGGFWDVYRATTKPFAASHSCARALCDHSRDLTDEQLRAIAEKGGVVGINFLTGFLSPTAKETTIELVLQHLRHMQKVAGIGTLALGSDYDGMGSTLEWGDFGGMQTLAEAIEKEFGHEDAEKICFKNALRFFRDVIGE